MFSCEFCKIYKNTFLHRTRLVAASALDILVQKQSIGGVLWKKCSWKFPKIHRKTLVPESLFNEIADPRLRLLVEKAPSWLCLKEFEMQKNQFTKFASLSIIASTEFIWNIFKQVIILCYQEILNLRYLIFYAKWLSCPIIDPSYLRGMVRKHVSLITLISLISWILIN